MYKKYLLNEDGHFGVYGGSYLPELVRPVMEELKKEFYKAKKDRGFLKELRELYNNYAGRPTPLYYCKNLTEKLGGAKFI